MLEVLVAIADITLKVRFTDLFLQQMLFHGLLLISKWLVGPASRHLRNQSVRQVDLRIAPWTKFILRSR